MLVASSPPVRSRIKGVLLTLEVLPSPIRVLSAVTPDPTRSEIEISKSKADLYRPRGFSTARRIVLIHGGNPEGKDDPRVRRLASGLAASGREVLVPELNLRQQRLDLEDLNRIREAVALPTGKRVGLVAFSYGAALAMVAVGETPELQNRIEFIATVGTYFDLRHLIYGVTTGKVPYHGSLANWETVKDARRLVAEQLASFVSGERGVALLDAWRRHQPGSLEPETRAIFDLLDNRDPARVDKLIAGLDGGLRDLLTRLSPSAIVDRISVPVVALHSRRDQAAPSTESRLLVEALRDRVEAVLFEIGILEHVSPVASPFSHVRDGWRLAAFAARIIEKQESWPRI